MSSDDRDDCVSERGGLLASGEDIPSDLRQSHLKPSVWAKNKSWVFPILCFILGVLFGTLARPRLPLIHTGALPSLLFGMGSLPTYLGTHSDSKVHVMC